MPELAMRHREAELIGNRPVGSFPAKAMMMMIMINTVI